MAQSITLGLLLPDKLLFTIYFCVLSNRRNCDYCRAAAIVTSTRKTAHGHSNQLLLSKCFLRATSKVRQKVTDLSVSVLLIRLSKCVAWWRKYCKLVTSAASHKSKFLWVSEGLIRMQESPPSTPANPTSAYSMFFRRRAVSPNVQV